MLPLFSLSEVFENAPVHSKINHISSILHQTDAVAFSDVIHLTNFSTIFKTLKSILGATYNFYDSFYQRRKKK